MNSITLIGRLTADPESRSYEHDGVDKTLARFRIAVDRGSRDGADYVDVITFGGTAEAVLDYVGKGRKVGICGRLESNEWETETGDRRYGHQVRASQVDFLEKPQASS